MTLENTAGNDRRGLSDPLLFLCRLLRPSLWCWQPRNPTRGLSTESRLPLSPVSGAAPTHNKALISGRKREWGGVVVGPADPGGGALPHVQAERPGSAGVRGLPAWGRGREGAGGVGTPWWAGSVRPGGIISPDGIIAPVPRPLNIWKCSGFFRHRLFT